MKMYDSLSLKEIKAKLQPVVIRPRLWSFGSSISQILKCKRTHSGNYVFLVKLKDGKVITVAENNMPERYNSTIKDMKKEFHRKKLLDPISLPKKKKKHRLMGPKSARKSQLVKNKTVINSDDIDIDDDELFFDSSINIDAPAVNHTTSSGRKTVQPKYYDAEFYRPTSSDSVKPVKRQHIERTFQIPLYTEESFKEHHSNYCMKCNTESSKDSHVVDVSIGYNESRSRFLLCNTCSLSFHNNCVTIPAVNVEKKTGRVQCQKCAKSGKCYGCNESLFNKSKAVIVPLRCSVCYRAFHFDCLIPSVSSDLKEAIKVYDSVDVYQPSRCFECTIYLSKTPESVLTERTIEDRLEYFVKWKGMSFRKAEWVVATWLLHAYSGICRSYIKRKEKGKIVPFSKEWLVIDRILDVRWEDDSKQRAQSVLAVFKDRDYAEAVWDDPPTKEETDLYPDYEIALNRYRQASNVLPPVNMKNLVSQVRSRATAENYEKHELKVQPKFITGGQLMKHQMDALNWLIYQWEKEDSCILADDMGLGKTIQIVTFLYYLFKKFSIYPFFIVVPNSTATNWIREFEKWAPELVVAPYFGSKEAKKLALTNEILNSHGQLKCHVVVCTYESALERSSLYNMFWPVMVIDESQRLKNDESLLFKNLTKLRVDHKILLTGTPLQNNLRELFNLMQFIQPEEFEGKQAEEYEELDATQVEKLHARLRPHFLRRTKQEVLKTLPPKYELIVPVSMTSLQKEVYKQCLSGEIHETLAQATMTKRQKGLSSVLMNLRKVLNHPYLLDGVETNQPTLEETHKNMINASAKLKLFHQMLPKLIERGHRMLIFSTMTRTLDILEDYFAYETILYARIDGNTKERERVRQIDAFNAPDSPLKVFLLSTRAGGVGINLATADTVIIWDSDFNPNADFQAISRAHRIGQTKMVLIYRLMTRLSVEERVLQIAKKRIALEHVVVEKMNNTEDEDLEDIESILKYGTEALFSNDDQKDITYDAASVENLLDREQYREEATKQQVKEVKELGEKAAENTGTNFAFAKVWQIDGSTKELAEEETDDGDTDFWEKFLVEQQAIAEKKKEEKRLAEMNLGRGARKRAVITYNEKFLNGSKAPTEEVKEKDDDYVFNEIEEISESELDPEFQGPGSPTKKLKPNNYDDHSSSQTVPSGLQQSAQQFMNYYTQSSAMPIQLQPLLFSQQQPITQIGQVSQVPIAPYILPAQTPRITEIDQPPKQDQPSVFIQQHGSQQVPPDQQTQEPKRALSQQGTSQPTPQKSLQETRKILPQTQQTGDQLLYAQLKLMQQAEQRFAQNQRAVYENQQRQEQFKIQQQLHLQMQHQQMQHQQMMAQHQYQQQQQQQQQLQQQLQPQQLQPQQSQPQQLQPQQLQPQQLQPQQLQPQQLQPQPQQQQLQQQQLELQRQQEEHVLQKRREQAALDTYTKMNHKLLMSWIDEKLLSYKKHSEKNIQTNCFNLELFNASRHALIEDIKTSLLERTKDIAEKERRKDLTRNINIQLVNRFYEVKISVANENVARLDGYIKSELEKLTVELEKLVGKQRQDTITRLNALQALVRKQDAERKALEMKQKRELIAATTTLLLPGQTSNLPSLPSAPQRQAIAYSPHTTTTVAAANQGLLQPWFQTQAVIGSNQANTTTSSANQYSQPSTSVNTTASSIIQHPQTVCNVQKRPERLFNPNLTYEDFNQVTNQTPTSSTTANPSSLTLEQLGSILHFDENK